MSSADLVAFWLTLKLAGVSTLILLLLGTPLAWWLAQTKSKTKFLVEAIVALPLVLPPTVLGFYLLVAMGPQGPVGSIVQSLGLGQLSFSFAGLVVGSVIYSLPFVIQPMHHAFAEIGSRPIEVARTLGSKGIDLFASVIFPLARRGYITAAVLGFAHTLGEFGVVLMIGGNIPGETQVLSIAIYDHVSALEYGQAHILSGGLLVLSFLLLVFVYRTNRRFDLVKP